MRIKGRVCVGRVPYDNDGYGMCANRPFSWHACGFVGGCDWFDYGGVWFEYWTCGQHLDTYGFVALKLDSGDADPCSREG